jgi:hypothetical protein
MTTCPLPPPNSPLLLLPLHGLASAPTTAPSVLPAVTPPHPTLPPGGD